MWQRPRTVTRMTVHDHAWLTGSRSARRQLTSGRGYSFDYVSDRLLHAAQVNGAARGVAGAIIAVLCPAHA